jgi:hypothetical protein
MSNVSRHTVASVLRLHFEPDSDGTGELFVEVAHGAFAGVGSAWFNAQELRAFGEQLQTTFPIPAGAPLELRGGFWDSNAQAVQQLHVELRVYPIGGVGTVGFRVTLATPVHREERPDSQCTVAVELQTKYEQLRAFGEAVAGLVVGGSEPAVLYGGDG